MKTPIEAPRAVVIGLFALCSLLLGGCAATQVALEHKDLQVETKMSATIFLDVEARTEKTVFLDIKNTSDRDLDIRPLVESRLTANGYTIVPIAKDAFYILQLNILQVGETNPSALHESLYAGWGGALGGMAAGAAIGGNRAGGWNAYNGAGRGAAIGGLIGSAGELIAGSLIKDVTYSMITDLQILERSNEAVQQEVQSDFQQGAGTRVTQTSGSISNRKKYQTRIVSSANKVNLKFEEALPKLEDGLARSVAGLL